MILIFLFLLCLLLVILISGNLSEVILLISAMGMFYIIFSSGTKYILIENNNMTPLESEPVGPTNCVSDDVDDMMGYIKHSDAENWGILGGSASGDMDEKTTVKQLHSGRRNKSAIDGFSAHTQKYNFSKYYDKELQENEGRVWYSHEATSDDVHLY